MFAKQILVSASLVIAFGRSVRAQPAATPPSTPAIDDEAAPTPPPPPAEPPADPPHHGTGTFSVGAGFNSDDSFMFGANISQSNLFHTGNSLALDAKLSARLQRFAIDFAHPHLFGGNATLETGLYNERRVLPGFARVATGGQVTLRSQLGDHVTGFLTFRAEHVATEALGDGFLSRGGSAPSPGGDANIISLATGIRYSTLDQPIAPLHGTEAGLSFETADPMFGSDVQLAKLNAWANTHKSLGPFTMHLGGSIASVTSKDPNGVPLSERLFLDGSSQIRGYAPGALAPAGANFSVLGRAELEAPLWRRAGISAIGFYDVGGFADTKGFAAVGQSVGFGLLWRSPIGPLCFDWAFPLDGGKPVFLLNVGGTF